MVFAPEKWWSGDDPFHLGPGLSSGAMLVLRKGKYKISYDWWKKSCTSWYGKYPIIYRVSYIPGGAGFLPSTVALDVQFSRLVKSLAPLESSFEHQQHENIVSGNYGVEYSILCFLRMVIWALTHISCSFWELPASWKRTLMGMKSLEHEPWYFCTAHMMFHHS